MSIARYAIAEEVVAAGPVAPATNGRQSKRRIRAKRDSTLVPEPR